MNKLKATISEYSHWDGLTIQVVEPHKKKRYHSYGVNALSCDVLLQRFCSYGAISKSHGDDTFVKKNNITNPSSIGAKPKL
jgi:hypothetical protein